MNFEQEYQLKEFRKIQNQYFDKDGNCYTGIGIGTDIMERMLKLINVLSERKESTEYSDEPDSKALHIADVSNLLIMFLKKFKKTDKLTPANLAFIRVFLKRNL